jgi:hypothetical protein
MSNIRATGGVNPQLSRVDYSPKLNATVQTGLPLAQARLNENLRLIDEANKTMDEFKQKQEERKKKNQAISFIQKLSQNNNDATKSVFNVLNINPEDTKEIGNFVDTLGGPQKAVSTLQESIASVEEIQRDTRKENLETKRIQNIGNVLRFINTGQTTPGTEDGMSTAPSTKGEAINFMLNQGITPEEVDKYKDLINLPEVEAPVNEMIEFISVLNANVTKDDTKASQLAKLMQAFPEHTKLANQLSTSIVILSPVDKKDIGKAWSEDFELMEKDKEAGGAYNIDFKKGIIRSKVGNKELRPGDIAYESLKRSFPDGVEELERRRLYFGGKKDRRGDPLDDTTREELEALLEQYLSE